MATKKCTTCGKTRKMAKGGSAGCPPGYYIEYTGGPCLKIPKTFDGPSVKVAGAILGTGISALGARIASNISENRKEKKEIKKSVDETAKKITNKVMKKGGMVKKRTTTKKK
jgi:hypothetical protein